MLQPILQTLSALAPGNSKLKPTRSPLAKAQAALDHAERQQRALALAALACAACQFKSRKGATVKHMSAWLTARSEEASLAGRPRPWDCFSVAHNSQGLAKLVNAHLNELSVCGLGITAVPEAELQDAKRRYRSCGELLPHPQARP